MNHSAGLVCFTCIYFLKSFIRQTLLVFFLSSPRANVILFLVYGLVPVVFGIAFIPFISTNSNYGMFEYGEKLKPGNKDALLKIFQILL